MKKLIFFVIFFMVFSMSSIYPMAWVNKICAMVNACTDQIPTQSVGIDETGSTSLAQLEVLGATSFYEAQTSFSGLKIMVERDSAQSKKSTEEYIGMISAAHYWIDKTVNTYLSFLSQVNGMEKNILFVNSLMMFDYNSYASKNGVNQRVFNTVKSCLLRGDIVGILQYIVNESLKIKTSLESMKKTYTQGEIVEIEKIWALNQKFSDLDLFGQYYTTILNKIRIIRW